MKPPGPLTPRDLPPVHALLDQPALVEAAARHGRPSALRAARAALDEARAAILRGEPAAIDPGALADRASQTLDAPFPALRRVLNATGILLHTGLGRAPLAPEAVAAVVATAAGYCNLEIDLETGDRGRRTGGAEALLCRLTGAEAAAVVNNNAAATVLALRSLALGREVVVSRGQLVEIGGSFRLPEIFEVSGARLREVGTTNRTRLSDYENALGPETAALLRVHPSNYQVVGFTESVAIGPLAALARARGLFAIDDIGSGALGPALPSHAPGEPTFTEGIAAGADLVLASGDKLLGGPQCGLLVGNRSAVARVERDPLMRALRVDKLTLAALEATLTLALRNGPGEPRIPLWAFLQTSRQVLLERAGALADELRGAGLDARAVPSLAYLGGGSAPGAELPSVAVAIAPPFPPPCASASAWAAALRTGPLPVVARVHQGLLLFDLRALPAADDADLLAALLPRADDRLPGG